MSTRIYIDTRAGAATLFSPPPACTDYKAWLLRRYYATRGDETRLGDNPVRMSRGGVHQAITAALHASRAGTPITFLGPHRDAAAEVFRQLGGTPS